MLISKILFCAQQQIKRRRTFWKSSQYIEKLKIYLNPLIGCPLMPRFFLIFFFLWFHLKEFVSGTKRRLLIQLLFF